MTAPRTVLVVDDDARLRDLLQEYLTSRGYEVRTASDGEQCLQLLRSVSVDLVVLDVMMPGQDGFDVLRSLRRFSEVPVVMLTARGDEMDRIIGLEIGADDYLPKPFNPRELLARMQAILRRLDASPGGDQPRISAGPIAVDADRRTVTLDGAPIEFTSTEFDILRTLVANAGRVIARERLMELARGEEFASFDRSVDVHVSHIRKKLGDDSKRPRLLKTVRGVGYTVPQDPG